MSKRRINITSLAELEHEEREVRKRIKLQEAELSARVKKMPEELVTTAVMKLLSSVLKGTALTSVKSFVKKIGQNVFSGILKEIL